MRRLSSITALVVAFGLVGAAGVSAIAQSNEDSSQSQKVEGKLVNLYEHVAGQEKNKNDDASSFVQNPVGIIVEKDGSTQLHVVTVNPESRDAPSMYQIEDGIGKKVTLKGQVHKKTGISTITVSSAEIPDGSS